ncbi:hypothetical protein N657DRAFT_692664 [Parathielavia appendiculata]|uniref:Uncharacterized protein n=1 Tax=Parathielavia appendiculata TaxID=2587402 RepID=A0AAN6Z090_9PEZI|nr:hypothetical protein N657DRAFT_692664 [Parathielavia appendiculata]
MTEHAAPSACRDDGSGPLALMAFCNFQAPLRDEHAAIGAQELEDVYEIFCGKGDSEGLNHKRCEKLTYASIGFSLVACKRFVLEVPRSRREDLVPAVRAELEGIENDNQHCPSRRSWLEMSLYMARLVLEEILNRLKRYLIEAKAGGSLEDCVNVD